jgi:hypothetical protein
MTRKTHPMIGPMNVPARPVTPRGYSFGQMVGARKIVSEKEKDRNGISFIKNTRTCQAKNSGSLKYLQARSFSQYIVFFADRC